MRQMGKEEQNGATITDLSQASMSRRRLLEWMAMVSAGSALASCGGAPKPVVTLPSDAFSLADVHCHVFNLRDLAAADFIKLAVRGHAGDDDSVDNIIRFVSFALARGVSTPEEELARLQREAGEAAGAARRNPPENDDRSIDTLAEFLKSEHGQARQMMQRGLTVDKLSSRGGGHRLLFEFLRASPHGRGAEVLNLQGPIDFREVAIVGLRRAAASDTIVAPAGFGDLSAQPDTPCPDLDYLYAARWVLWFTYDRNDLLAELMRLQTSELAPAKRIFTPAMVDFDHWLIKNADRKPASEMPSRPSTQNAVMAAVAKRNTKGQTLVLPVCAFDPMRQLVDEKTKADRPLEHAITVVRTALETQGAIGIKIYPPMGFRLWGNKALNGNFGDRVPNSVTDPQSGYADLGSELDARLARAYALALEFDVPIVTHVNNSQGPARLDKLIKASWQASPEWAEAMLGHVDAGGKKPFAKLKINLGHSGGPWCLGGENNWCRAGRGSGDSGERHPCAQKTTKGEEWFDVVMRLLASKEYPNVYADFSDFDLVMNPDMLGRVSKIVDDFLQRLAIIDAANGADKTAPRRILSKLLYGTDWMFLGLQPGAGDYVRRMRDDVIARVANVYGVQVTRDFFFDNALRYLGLDKSNARIEGFLGANLDWLRTGSR